MHELISAAAESGSCLAFGQGETAPLGNRAGMIVHETSSAESHQLRTYRPDSTIPGRCTRVNSARVPRENRGHSPIGDHSFVVARREFPIKARRNPGPPSSGSLSRQGHPTIAHHFSGGTTESKASSQPRQGRKTSLWDELLLSSLPGLRRTAFASPR